MNGSFEVEEYKKPEYEVRVTPAKARVLQGEAVQAVIDSRYYFGEPVNGAKVKYAVYRDRYWFPLWYEPDDDAPQEGADAEGNDYGDDRSPTAKACSMPKASSPSTFRPRSPTTRRITGTAWKRASPMPGKREITGRGWVVATYGSFVVNVRPDRYFYQPELRGRSRWRPATTTSSRCARESTWSCCAGTGGSARSGVRTGAPADVDTGADGTGIAQIAIPRRADRTACG